MTSNIIYIVVSILVMYVFRRGGWFFSKKFYIKFTYFHTIAFCLFWGFITAVAISYLIYEFDPNILVKIIFGFLMGCYIAIPNYKLFDESSIPAKALKKHKALSIIPLLIYIVLVVIYAWHPF